MGFFFIIQKTADIKKNLPNLLSYCTVQPLLHTDTLGNINGYIRRTKLQPEKEHIKRK